MSDTVLRLTPEIIIGPDTINRAGALCHGLGHKILVATEQGLSENKLVERLIKILEDEGLETILFDEISAQATMETVENVVSLLRGACCDMILGFGGLKTQYIARLTSILAASSLELFDILDGKRDEDSFLPYVAIPVITGDPFLLSDHLIAVDPRDKCVKLVKCPPTLCKALILDPDLFELASGKLGSIAAFEGLCFSIEAYCSARASFFSDALLEKAISLYAQMTRSYQENPAADYHLISVHAELLMSMGVSASAPGIGTALAYALNGKFPAPKSLCATILLPHIMKKLAAARPDKMAKVAALMGETVEGLPTAEAANMGIDVVSRRMEELRVSAKLRDFNLSLDQLVPVSDTAQELEFVASSPWTVSAEEAYEILKETY